MELQLAVPASVPAVALLRSLADQLETMKPVAVLATSTARIGAAWSDGIYAGMARGEPDYPLIVGEESAKELTWKDALAWAEKVGNGWRVPTRAEAWLLKANVPELFKDEWYWTSAQYEGVGGYAWAQHFSYGGQSVCRKDGEFRVRLVRSY